jgi:hypothetical protein
VETGRKEVPEQGTSYPLACSKDSYVRNEWLKNLGAFDNKRRRMPAAFPADRLLS